MNAQTMITSLLLFTVIGAHSSPKFTNKKQAAEVAAAPVSTHSPNIASGVRLEFLKSFFDGKVKLNNGLSSASGSGKVEHSFSLGLGYATIQEQALGFLGRFIFTQHNSTADSIRLDGNATYGVSNQVYLFGGLNLNKFVKGPDELNAGIGFQVGTGFQVTPNFGLTLST